MSIRHNTQRHGYYMGLDMISVRADICSHSIYNVLSELKYAHMLSYPEIWSSARNVVLEYRQKISFHCRDVVGSPSYVCRRTNVYQNIASIIQFKWPNRNRFTFAY